MMRFAIPLLLAAACSGKAKQEPTAGSGSGSAPALYAKKLMLGWGIQDHNGTSADVFLQTTDETGKQTSYPLGTFPGDCKIIKPPLEMKAVTAVACTTGAGGTELDAVTTDTEIIILKGKSGSTDPMGREEVTRVRAAGGAKIESGT